MNTRYDWSKAPEWAKFAATDSNGTAYWYKTEPYIARTTWQSDWEMQIIDEDQWRKSLEARP